RARAPQSAPSLLKPSARAKPKSDDPPTFLAPLASRAMSHIARSRLALTLRSSAAPFSTISPAAAASLASKEAPAAAAASSAPKEAAAAGDPSPAPPSGARSSFRLLKAGIFTAVTAALGATGYVTYAYSVDEVDQMTREFRKNSKLPISEDLSGFEVTYHVFGCSCCFILLFGQLRDCINIKQQHLHEIRKCELGI
uniref:Uncharacterized protein n=1 Tax=Aegilops tauschii subsp. strangulata TaxID=200361 RepID=A0A453FKE5_AEGTS